MPETVSTYRAMQVRTAEQPLIAAGVPLMRRAASALAAVVREELGDAVDPRVLVLVGPGDNGGDALYAAASLAAVADVSLMLVSSRFHEAALTAATAADAELVELPDVRDEASQYHVVVDGILGIGGTPPLRGTAREAVLDLLPAVRAGRPKVVAVDLPSGLHPDTGSSDGVVLPALVTVTFGAVKAGLGVGQGPSLCGRVVLVRLGLERALADEVPAGEMAVDRVIEG